MTASAIMLGLVAGNAVAQEFAITWNPRSGDAWVDAWLGDMNRYGTRYREPFVDEMVRYHGAPRELVTELLVSRHWAPGDVYYACTLAQVVDRACRDVADEWQVSHSQGWGVVARRLGVQPGSAGFQRLKNGFVPTYDRWARPIMLDAVLERVYPGRAPPGKAPKGGKDGKPDKRDGDSKAKAPTDP